MCQIYHCVYLTMDDANPPSNRLEGKQVTVSALFFWLVNWGEADAQTARCNPSTWRVLVKDTWCSLPSAWTSKCR